MRRPCYEGPTVTHKNDSRLGRGAASESGALITLIAIPSMQSFGHATNKLQCENLIRFHGQGDANVEVKLIAGQSGYVQAPGANVWACCTRLQECFFAGSNRYRLFPENLN